MMKRGIDKSELFQMKSIHHSNANVLFAVMRVLYSAGSKNQQTIPRLHYVLYAYNRIRLHTCSISRKGNAMIEANSYSSSS